MVWDLATGKHVATLFGHIDGVWCLKFDTLHVVSGSQDGRVIVRAAIVGWRGGPGRAQTGSFGPARNRTGRGRRGLGQIREWDETGAATLDAATVTVFTLEAHTDAVNCIDLTESRVISGSNDGLIHVWDFGISRP